MCTATQSLARRIGRGGEREKKKRKKKEQKEQVRGWHGYLGQNPDGIAQAKGSEKKKRSVEPGNNDDHTLPPDLFIVEGESFRGKAPQDVDSVIAPVRLGVRCGRTLRRFSGFTEVCLATDFATRYSAPEGLTSDDL